MTMMMMMMMMMMWLSNQFLPKGTDTTWPLRENVHGRIVPDRLFRGRWHGGRLNRLRRWGMFRHWYGLWVVEGRGGFELLGRGGGCWCWCLCLWKRRRSGVWWMRPRGSTSGEVDDVDVGGDDDDVDGDCIVEF